MTAGAAVLRARPRVPGRRTRRRLIVLRGVTDWVGVICVAVFLLMATVGQWISGSPYTLDTLGAEPPSMAHWLGTDNLGRDVFARTAHGAWASLLISVFSVLLGLVIALPLGIVAGYHHGRRTDELISRSLELLQALPTIIFGMFVLMLLGNGPMSIGPFSVGMEPRIVICIGLAFVPFYARVVRASTIEEMQEDYVACQQVLGVRSRSIIAGEISVNVLPQIITQALLGMAIAIFAEGGLGFLGLGVQQPTPEWGSMLGEGRQYIFSNPNMATFPGLAIFLTVLGFNLAGDGLRDAIDPGLRRR